MAVAFAVATAFALIAILAGFSYYTTITAPQTNKTGAIRQLCRALYPDFTWPNNGRDTTQTFHFMLSAMVVFGIVLTLWSIGAGAMHAVYLLNKDDAKMALTGAHCTANGCEWETWLFTMGEIVRALGGVTLLCLAGGLIGGFLGFLFGIPRRISADSGAATDKNVNGDKAGSGYSLSTNLTQISDWLTKVIVGVSLVEARSAYDGFVMVTNTSAFWLFENRHGSPAVLAAALAGGAVFGFLFFYLYTQLIIARLLAAADRALSVAAGATERLGRMVSYARQLAPPIRRTATPTDTDPETAPEDYTAALTYYAIPFSELVSNPLVSDEEVLGWARSRAMLNDYRDAVLAYFFLLARKRA